jgi:hypothetical protein
MFMMTKRLSAIAITLLAAMPLAHAATVELTWGDPVKFRDIRTAEGNQKRYQQEVMDELASQFKSQAEKLPADQILKINIKDLDLAGDLEYFHSGFPFGLRVVRNVDFPGMKLSYELRDSKNQVLKAGDSDVSDLGFRDGIQLPYQTGSYYYEKKMIKQWYQREFSRSVSMKSE